MPTRKQRRRQQKLRRHEYEEVWVDEEGHEIDVDPATAAPASKRSANGAPRTRTAKPAPARDAKGRPLREIQPPSWPRVLKRAAIFLPIMYLVISLTSKNVSTPGRILNALVLALLLVPTMYFMDRVTYRAFLKRTGRAPQPEPRRKRGD